MKTQQIIFTAPRVAELQEHSLPELQADEVLVKTAVSTISSGTERANVSGDINVSINEHATEAKFPRYPGYSSAGTIEAVGANVTNFAVGDRVVVSWGFHSAYQILKAEHNVCKITDDKISFEEAALCHIATFPIAAIRKCHLELGESAIVMGLGVLGMTAVQLLRAAGAVPVIAADPVPEKRAEALRLGADYALDPYAPDFAKTVKELTHGGANVAIEVTGFGTALDEVLDCMAKMGRVALLGCTRSSDFTIDYYHKVHGPGISLIGAHTAARPKLESAPGLWTTLDDDAAILRLISANRIHFTDMIGETHSPTACGEIYQRLCDEKAFPLVQFDWRLLSAQSTEQ